MGREAAPASGPGAEFAAAYRRRFGSDPQPFAAHAFDAATIAVKAIEAVVGRGAPLTRESVARAVREVAHDGITGRIELDS